jgi:hypothetical protein
MRDEVSRLNPDKISLSSLSQSKMRKIIDDVGLQRVIVSTLFLYYLEF